MSIHQVKELLKKYYRGECAAWEEQLVEDWFKHLEATGDANMDGEEKKMFGKVIKSRIWEQIEKKNYEPKVHRIFEKRLIWWAAAVAVVLLGVTVIYHVFHNEDSVERMVAFDMPNDIRAPQSSRAMISFSNGHHVYLDSTANGSLLVQDGVKVIKLADGQIAYQHVAGNIPKSVESNTLTNPNGSRVINMTLSDGSRIWLNAGSSLTFPIAFIGEDRRVSITGEAFFEVAPNPSKPFIVQKDAVSIRVLGTHFNVNSFNDDGGGLEITLLEGSVKVDNGKSTNMLKPGQQAQVGNAVNVVKKVDVDAVVAWKNGYFHFENASLGNVMRQIARWYDLRVVYEGDIKPRAFVGEIQRDLGLSEVLTILEQNKIHFRIVEKTLFVSGD